MGDNMNKTNRVRMLFLITTGFICVGYYIGYEILSDYTNQRAQQQNILTAEQPVETETSGENQDESTEAEISKMNIPYQYVIVEEEGYLTVYMQDLSTIYMYTAIRMQDLSTELQDEIRIGKPFTSLEDLYEFLENYSS